MAHKQTKSTLVAAVGFLALLSVACGTRGNNIRFPEDETTTTTTTTGTTGTTGTTTATTTTGGVTSGALTGGVTGVTPVINPTATPTAIVGLAAADVLATNDALTGREAPTRLALGDFGTILGQRPVVVQGNNGPTPRITLLARNPGTPAGTGNLRLTVTTAGGAGQINSPFALLVRNVQGGLAQIFISDGLQSQTNGRVLRIDGIDANTGAATATQIALNLNRPIDMTFDANEAGGRIYVANYSSLAAGGSIVAVDPAGVAPQTTLISGLNFPSSVVVDNSNGRRLLYVTENASAGAGNNGRVLRFDLATFVRGGAPFNGGTPNTGVTNILPFTGDQPYLFPWDLAVDGSGNVVVSDGFTYNADSPAGFTAPAGLGSVRVITRAGGTPSITSRQVVRGLTGPRGLSLTEEGASGDDNTVFFVEGSQGQNSFLRQLTFRNTDAAIYRFLTLANPNNSQNAFDTLYDPGTTTGTPVVPPNVKFTANFFSPTQGSVFDVR